MRLDVTGEVPLVPPQPPDCLTTFVCWINVTPRQQRECIDATARRDGAYEFKLPIYLVVCTKILKMKKSYRILAKENPRTFRIFRTFWICAPCKYDNHLKLLPVISRPKFRWEIPAESAALTPLILFDKTHTESGTCKNEYPLNGTTYRFVQIIRAFN